MDSGISLEAEAESSQTRDRIFVCQVESGSKRVAPRMCDSERCNLGGECHDQM
jgi:hypothetical protein